MQAPGKGAIFKTHFDISKTQSALLDKQKDTLLAILTDYIDKTADKTTTLEKLQKIQPTVTSISKPCTNC